MTTPPASALLSRRIAGSAGAATLSASLLAGWLGGGGAALGVLAVALLTALYARATWGRQLAAWDRLGEPEAVARSLREAGEVRTAAEGQVAAMRARVDAMLEATPNGVGLVDGDGRIVRVNSLLCSMLDLSGSPEGRLPVEVLRAPDALEVIAEAAAGRDVIERIFSTDSRDLAVAAYPMAGSMDGGVLVILRDVTRVRMAERARTDFVANVSHELRTPIATILGYAESLLIDADGLPEDVARMIRVIERHGQRLHRLFEDLLMLHKLEARRKEFPRAPVRLAPLCAEASAVAADTAGGRGISFSVEVAEDLVAEGNREALRTIVGNLAGNAVKYTPDGGRITIRGVREGEDVRIDVVDTGPGIPKASQERVFERFFRLDEGRSREVGGTGLGLSIVKHLADATGARVEVVSEEGQGSTFRVHLPRPAEKRPVRTWDETLRDDA